MVAKTKAELIRSGQVAAEYRDCGYGPGTPAAERRQAALEMSAQGATLADIARLFGVTPEAARHWVRERRAVYLTEDEADLVMKYRKEKRAGDTRVIIWMCFHCGEEKTFATHAECDQYAGQHYDENHAAKS